MVKIIEKVNDCIERDEKFFSFEYFPPKTEKGIENLYARFKRMSKLKPLFIDVTWGAGGSTAGKTIEISANAQEMINLEAQIHMTCTNMKVEELDKSIELAKSKGIDNILALRGDPPQGSDEWQQTQGGFAYAVDLIKYIKKNHGDDFGIACAGYSEGHPDGNYEDDLKYLKDKCDAGAQLVVTQLFYDWQQFLKFVKDAKEIGIKAPIIPGIMPINNYKSWEKMTSFCKTVIPDAMKEQMSKVNKEDDDAMKAFGIKYCIQMCRQLLDNGIPGLHFYTLNLDKNTKAILEGLELIPDPNKLPKQLSLKNEKAMNNEKNKEEEKKEEEKKE